MSGSERALATVLFTDIVGSTKRATTLGDRAWRDLLEEHHARVRRELRRVGGRELNTSGDGFLAVFQRPARAIACADAIRSAVRSVGLEVRCGVHMGEVEGMGKTVGGIGVHIAARVMAEAGSGEVLVSRSVRDSVEGAGFEFEDRGNRTLKGVAGEWRLFAVTVVPEDASQAVLGRWPGIIRRRHALVGGALVCALLLGAAAFYVSRRDAGFALTPEEVLAADAAPGIAVLPFTVNDPDLAMWREGMVDLLSVNLDGVFHLRAIDNRTVLARWAETVPDSVRPDLATALAVARQTGARYAVIGTVVAAGTDLRLTADVYEARDGSKLGNAQVAGSPDSIMGLVDRLSMELLRALPRSEGVLAEVNIAEITTDSLEALKAFLNGEALYRQADFQGSAMEYERALASDSTFALAWARLGDACSWSPGELYSELCDRDPPWEGEEYLSRLPARTAELRRAEAEFFESTDGIDFDPLRQVALRFPDDPDVWYTLGDAYTHWGGMGLVDREEGDRALERAIALAPTTSAEPYIHLIEHAFAEADSARVARLLDAYEGITAGATAADDPAAYPLAFALGFGDPDTHARAVAALDTVPTTLLLAALSFLGNPRFHDETEAALRVALARSDNEEPERTFTILYVRGKLRAALDAIDDPVIHPAIRSAMTYQMFQIGANLPAGLLESVLAAGVADSTSSLLSVGAHAANQGHWDQYAAALDRQDARARYWRAEGDLGGARHHESIARALEGYALWKRGRKAEAIPVLEAAQRRINGGEPHRGVPSWFSSNVRLRWWLGELMLEVGRPRDAERYFKAIAADPFAALRLARVYENLGEFEKARSSYEFALLSLQDADPELQPRIQEARRGLARLPKPLRRD